MTLPVTVLPILLFLSPICSGIISVEAILGSDCQPDGTDCDSVPAADCITSVCTCIGGYETDVNTDTCLGNGTLGYPCNTNVNPEIPPSCFDQNAICNIETSVCVCPTGFGDYSQACFFECGNTFTDLTDGRVTFTGNKQLSQLEASFICNPGFVINGPELLTCRNGGTWSEDPPTCDQIPTTIAPTTPPATTQTATTAASTTAAPVCNPSCQNGATCTNVGGQPTCVCRDGFSGTSCEVEDYCVTQPCPTDVECVLVQNEPNVNRYCICPVGTRGPGCTLSDQPIVCRDVQRKIFFDNSDLSEESLVCIEGAAPSAADICYDPDGPVKFEVTSNADLVQIEDTAGQPFCVQLNITSPTVDKNCIEIVAFQADDFGFRPGVNSTSQVCYVYNSPPNFTSPTPIGVVRINVFDMVATETIQLAATDLDAHQSTALSITGVAPGDFTGVFSLEGTSITVQKPSEALLLEVPVDVTVEVMVEDDGIPVLSKRVNITVRFINASLSCLPSKETYYLHTAPAPSTVSELGNILCTGQPVNSLSYTPQGPTGPLMITTEGLILYDPSKPDDGTFNIQVEVSSNAPPVAVTTTVDFTLIAADLSPQCTVSNLQPTFQETATVSTCSGLIYTCTSLDPSSTLQCADTSTEFDLRCDGEAVTVCLQESVRHNIATFLVSGSVTNQYGSETVATTVTVVNGNDLPTILVNATVLENVEVPETAFVGDTVITVSVSDADTTLVPSVESLTITLTDSTTGIATSTFGAVLNDDQDLVTISLLQPLNINVQSTFSLTLTVTDLAGLSDFVPMTVKVKDINEAPVCSNVPATKTVSIRSTVGTEVITLQCSDPDLDESLRTLTYSIQPSENSNFFAVDSAGILTVKTALTSLTTQGLTISITVLVSDGGGLSVTATVTITLLNSFPPECSQATIPMSLSENTGEATCTSLAHACLEPVQSGSLVFTVLETGNGKNLFRLGTSSSPADVSVCTKVSLKGQIGTWQLPVNASSSYGSTTFVISVTVTDVNDPPVLVNTTYEETISESLPVGAPVLTVIAEDPDTGVLGELTYYSQGIEESVYFNLETNTGLITVKAPLDAETSTTFLYRIRIIDGAPTPVPVTATVSITITDVNDQAPVCERTTIQAPVDVTAPVGTLITQLTCTDTDITPAFRQQVYSISPSNEFAVNSTGHVTVESPLDLKTNQYTLTVSVEDADRPTLSTAVQIFVSVNMDFPPNCTVLSITKDITESKPVGACLENAVICTDPLDTGVALVAGSVTGTGTALMEIRSSTLGGGRLSLNACVKSSLKNKFGTYTMSARVTNNLVGTTLDWTFTVLDLNEQPELRNLPASTTINETMSTGPIFAVSITDPDEGNPVFSNLTVTAVLTNNAEYNNALTESIFFVEGVRTFYATGSLNSTERDTYIYLITVTDGGGLYENGELTINVADVNEPPFCLPATMSATIDILKQVGGSVLQLQCQDSDKTYLNTFLDYSITSGDPDDYFNVTADGTIIVQDRLPRTNLYQTGKATLTITVEDRGSPRLQTSATAIITVNNQIPATCSPVITPPDVWVVDACATITMDCTDPTTNTSNHLTYTPSGNFSAGFRPGNSDVLGILSLCYNKTSSGYYEIIVRVGNGLSVYEFRQMIVVGYAQSTPVFTNTKYAASVSENLAIGSSVLMTSAESQDLIGSLIYQVMDTESTPGWSDYFILNEVTGEINTVTSLRPIADDLIVLRVKAEDTGSKLSSSAQVEIQVMDINEDPQCTNTPKSPSTISVDTPVGTVLTTFTCSDVDRKPEYNTLVYSIQEPTDSFSLTGSDAIYTIQTSSLLDINTDSYTVQMIVADSGTPPLSFIGTFVVDVELLPPAVTMVAVAVSYKVIEVTWYYERSDFYEVTNSFVVTIQPPGDAPVISSGVLLQDVASWNATGLSATTNYTVLVTANTKYGPRATEVQKVTTPEVPQISLFTAIIRVPNVDYTPLLRDTASKVFFDTRKSVLTNVAYVLKDSDGYAGVLLLGFRRANSIFVDLQVAVNQSGTVENTINVLNDTVGSGYINSLTVDPGYFVASVGGYIEVTTIRTTPDEIFNGSSGTIMCEAVAVGFSGNQRFRGSWTFNGNVIKPFTSSRYSISFSTDADIPEVKYTTLTGSPILARHAGTYECIVSNFDGTIFGSKSTTIEVISQPGVIVTPRSDTVSLGTSLNVTCEVSPASFSPFDGFNWYLNDALLQQRTDIEIVSGVSMETLVVSSISETTVFGCEGYNTAGIGLRVSSHIGVAKPGEPLCPAKIDGRGTSWPATVVGTSAVLNCAPGNKGEKTRYCGANGEWDYPVYNCVTDTLTNIDDELAQIEDGASTSNTTSVLKQLVSATNDVDLYNGDLQSSLNSLETISGIDDFLDLASTENVIVDTDNFLLVASNLIDERNRPTWFSRLQKAKGGAINVPRSVEQYIQRRVNRLYFTAAAETSRKFSVKNIYAEVGIGSISEPYEFPTSSQDPASTWIRDTSTKIFVPANAFKDLQSVHYGASFYKNITPILERKLFKDGIVEDVSSIYVINSDIVSLQVKDLSSTLDFPVTITFQHFDRNTSNPLCCYWDYTENAFKTDGCSLQSTSDEFTECSCNHLTNFAILMSPGKTPEADIMALSIISAVGCAISIVCLLLTIISHLVVWRFVKSDRAVLLLNLCLALIISYALFLGGVGQADMEDVCTAISLLLHYVYLVVFFLMLAYGVEILVSVKFVFVTRSRIRWLLPLAWGIPLVIVAISAGVTQLEGYGNEQFCWLSVDSGLLYAFVGPAGLCILINFIIVIIVFRTMFKSSAMLTKSDKEKAKVGTRSICVLLPILGLTWVFGIFSVNESMVAFQYIFAVLNSLQGFFIFLFHALLNAQIRDGFKQRTARKKSLATFESDFKQQRTASNMRSETSEDSSERKNNEPLAPGSNPFLEVDRQVQAMVLASKKNGTNLYDNPETKVLAKDKPAAVDLDDVKISNILRESEVMGGTAGISSILQSQNNADPGHQTDRRPQRQQKQSKKVQIHTPYDYRDMPQRQSKKVQIHTPHDYRDRDIPQLGDSSKRYDYIDGAAVDKNVSQTGLTKPPGYEKLLQSATNPHQYSSLNKGLNSDTDRSKEKDRERAREKERQRQREQEQKARDLAHQPTQVRIGYESKDRGSKEVLGVNKGPTKASRSSKSDEDRERDSYGSSSIQNITSINTAIPMKYDQSLGKQKKPEVKKKRPQTRDRDRSRDRSRDYEYSFEATYLGGQSRHNSQENVNMQNYGYSPYAQAPAYQRASRPSQQHQQQHHQQWDPYSGRPYQDPYDPYRGDYW